MSDQHRPSRPGFLILGVLLILGGLLLAGFGLVLVIGTSGQGPTSGIGGALTGLGLAAGVIGILIGMGALLLGVVLVRPR